MEVSSVDQKYIREINNLLLKKVVPDLTMSLKDISVSSIILPSWCQPQDKYVRRMLSNCVILNRRHLETCDCTKNYYDNLYSSFYNHKVDIINSVDDELSLISLREHMNNISDITYKELLDEVTREPVVCVKEVQVVLELLERFINKYDFSDPRVFGIVNTLVLNSLDVHRLMNESNFEGVVYKQRDKVGNVSFQVSPVVEARRRLGDSIMTAISSLDKIIEGDKHIHSLVNTEIFVRDAIYPPEPCLNPPEAIEIDKEYKHIPNEESLSEEL